MSEEHETFWKHRYLSEGRAPVNGTQHVLGVVLLAAPGAGKLTVPFPPALF